MARSSPARIDRVGGGHTRVGGGRAPGDLRAVQRGDRSAIADALAAEGKASVRRRKLPAEHVVWLVIGMGLFRERSIAHVVHDLDLVWPAARGERSRIRHPVSTLSHAMQR